ncbi:hypothetical protein FMN52_02865 [Marinobacter sp. BW6]|uniref:hypothetical protein n=1 Tax=Marinobacter sp. BW6 TaxID=2592624 RepID=UPI0011DE7471|nr:hypothetical protein [Marinobacter sp. BW6]TYC62717.1 hypothetical protein FMN52_02865 [Marinobacter sp. BW6]
MFRKELVLARRLDNRLCLVEALLSELNLERGFRLRPIPDFGFSFPEDASEILVAELVARTRQQAKEDEFLPFNFDGEKKGFSSIVILARVSQDLESLAFWLESGFIVVGSINAKAPLVESSLRASFPVDLFINGPIPPAVVIGRANVNLLAQVRALGECGVPVDCILTRDEMPVIARSSRYVREVFDCRNCTDDHVVECIKAISQASPAKPVVYTAGDLEIGLLARIWEDVRDLVLAPNDPKLSSQLNNKAVQIEKMKASGVKVPLSRVVEGDGSLESVIRDFSFPVICKPTELAKKGAFIGKTLIVENDVELRQRIGCLVSKGDALVLIQEYIPGSQDNIFFTLVACSRGGNVCSKIAGRKLMDDGRGCIGIGETVYDRLLEIESEKAFRGFSVGGVLGVEFKRHDLTGDFYFIEANFRPENTHAMAQAAGVNLSVITYLEAVCLGGLYAPLSYRKVTWMDASLVILRKLRTRSSKDSVRQRTGDKGKVIDALWLLADPLPAIVWYLLKSGSLIKRGFNRVVSRFYE